VSLRAAGACADRTGGSADTAEPRVMLRFARPQDKRSLLATLAIIAARCSTSRRWRG